MNGSHVNVSLRAETYIYLRSRSASEQMLLQDLIETIIIEHRLNHPEQEPPTAMVHLVRERQQNPVRRGRRSTPRSRMLTAKWSENIHG